MDEKLLDYTKGLIELQIESNKTYYGYNLTNKNVVLFLRPVSDRKEDLSYLLPYEDRVEIAKIYLEKLVNVHFLSGYKYFNSDTNPVFNELLSANGYECYLEVLSKNEQNQPIEWVKKTENFHQIYLDRLYKHWDEQVETWKEENKQKVFEMLFEFQLVGNWFYYNNYNQNFLRIYLEYLKNKGYKINIFEIFKKKIADITKDMKQGLNHFTKENLFKSILIIFDFYAAIIDLYGENNKKVITKLQTNLNYIFKEQLNVEKLGFMNTFLYTNYLKDRGKYYAEADTFWKRIYTSNLNPTLKKIFLNSLIYTWNKSPIPKVRNSIQLIANLSTGNLVIDGKYHTFPYANQSIFYKDLILNANNLKKSVKSILFSKAITQEGGLYLGS